MTRPTYRALARPVVLSLTQGARVSGATPSLVAVVHRADGSRVEFAVPDAVDAYVCDGPVLDRTIVLVSTPMQPRPRVDVIETRDLRRLVGAPEVLTALELYTSGQLKAAARLIDAAGAQWAPLVDLLGGPA